ncbi:MAG: YraN family protein [Candidatus Limnocylindria bacterium]
MPDPRHTLGERAEAAVAAWLAARGWTILARRWRCPEGEIDLVAIDPDGVLVAVEVKLRRGGHAGDPLESVDYRRLGRLRAALGRFSAEAPRPVAGIRLDLVAVRPGGQGQWRLTHHSAIGAW